MKQIVRRFSILSIGLIITAMASTAYGQAKSITREEFREQTAKAYEITETTFPRRETYSSPNERLVYGAGPVYAILSEVNITEFLAKDRIRYEFREINTKGTFVTKKIRIGTKCFDLAKPDDPQAHCGTGSGSGSGVPDKEDFFVESVMLGVNPMKIYRKVETNRVYAETTPPYIDEDLYYMDSAGRLVKRESFSRRGEGKSILQESTTYEFDVKIKPINPPPARKKSKRQTKR